MEFTNSGGFPSRRSYPNLNHVSLAPLTPRFPIDDDIEPEDYFSSRGDDDHAGSGTRTPSRISYLSSISVPSTPPILSHSRSSSRTRHARSKSSTRVGPLSDPNLHSKDVTFPLHHQATHKKLFSSSHPRRHFGDAGHANSQSDAEWMLRAGIALASSTREEKGQSWLSKRESSTSLVDLPLDDATTPHPYRHHYRTKSTSSRKSRSGASTPGAYSRRSSRSRGGSQRGSRAGLAMTTLPPLLSVPPTAAGKAAGPAAGTMTPEHRGRSSGLVPDFVDERIRAELASLQRERGLSDDESEYWDGEDGNDSEYDSYSDEMPDEFDEADLQRLTRERGFGLGGWIDRLVEWTLFGVEEWPAPVPSTAAATRIGATATTTTVTFEEPTNPRSDEEQLAHDSLSLASAEDDNGDVLWHTDGEAIETIEKPGAHGGWEDASWLFRLMKRALI